MQYVPSSQTAGSNSSSKNYTTHRNQTCFSPTYLELWQMYHKDVFHPHIAVVLVLFVLYTAHGSTSIIPAIFRSPCFLDQLRAGLKDRLACIDGNLLHVEAASVRHVILADKLEACAILSGNSLIQFNCVH